VSRVAEPLSDERLAEIRQRAERCQFVPDHPGSMFTWQDSAKDVPTMLAEVARLRDERDGLRRGRNSVRDHNYAAHQILTDALKAASVPPQQRPTLDTAATEAARIIRSHTAATKRAGATP
jgi:Lon protease-like protein